MCPAETYLSVCVMIGVFNTLSYSINSLAGESIVLVLINLIHDAAIFTDKHIENNRPYITIVHKNSHDRNFIESALP